MKSFNDQTLIIQLNSEDEFSAKGIKKNQLDLENIFEIYSGEKVKLSLEISVENLKPTINSSTNGIVEKPNGHPLFETIMETFDGEIIRG